MDAAAGMPHRNNGARLDKGFCTPADPGCPRQPTPNHNRIRNRFWISDCVPHLNGCCRRHATPKQWDPPGQMFSHTCRSGMSHATNTKSQQNQKLVLDFRLRSPFEWMLPQACHTETIGPAWTKVFAHLPIRDVPCNQQQRGIYSEIGSGFQIAFPI